MDLKIEKAKKIIASNSYLTLATTDGEFPWASPVHYGVDENNLFYFASMASSQHSRNIEKNPNVSFAIFDSTTPEGEGIGLQIKALASMVPVEEYGRVLEFYKSVFVPSHTEQFKNSPYLFYQLVPLEIYITDPESDTDERVLIKL